MGYTIRTGSPEDLSPILELLTTAFHDSADPEETIEIDRLVYEPQRSLLAIDQDRIIGHTGAFSRDLAVPGGVIPAAFVSMVGVSSAHRRQGVASALLTRQLRECTDPVAVLWASEGRIYQRFGYGLATRRLNLDIDTREVRLHTGAAGSIRVGSPQELRKDLAECYAAVWRDRPGHASRNEAWWDFVLSDPEARRHGFGAKRVVVHDSPSGVDGYALFRTKSSWNAAGPNGSVEVIHSVAATPAAYTAIWRYLTTIDLTRGTRLAFGALDEPLFDLVNEPRRLQAQMSDGLWLRVVDVPAALAGRRYFHSDLVLDVTDELLPENTGRYRLDGTRTTEPADIALDAATLGALYLGGGSAGALSAAGRITPLRDGAVARADAAFRWHRAPVGIDMF